jgi:2-hydroxy-3-keto-5-methylthiopentenyl-1-phosphate phosphatase
VLTYIIQNALESFVDRDSVVSQKGLIDLKAIVDESRVHNVVTDSGDEYGSEKCNVLFLYSNRFLSVC